jgi:hypothetical protein
LPNMFRRSPNMSHVLPNMLHELPNNPRHRYKIFAAAISCSENPTTLV